jgi:hypothetical protein
MLNNGCFLRLSDRINKLNVFSKKVVDILVECDNYGREINFLLVLSDGSEKALGVVCEYGVNGPYNHYEEMDLVVEALIELILNTLPYMDRKIREMNA